MSSEKEPTRPAAGSAEADDRVSQRIYREDAIAALLSVTVVGGLFLDGWNHLNLQNGRLGSFFTPWHGLLYAGFSANAMWVIYQNQHLWRADIPENPAFHRVGRYRLRYPFAMAGLLAVLAGMVGDLVWHTLFGEETNVARVIAPFHILLFLGAVLLIAAPLRSAWYAPFAYPRKITFVRLFPVVLAIALLTAAASFMLQWISPFMEWTASTPRSLDIVPPDGAAGLQTIMAARIVLANVVFVTPILLVMRRWSLPFGTATTSFGVAALAMSALTSFDLVTTCLAAVLGGAATDLVIRATERRPVAAGMFAVALIAPAACWPLYFLLLREAYGADWPVDFYLGVSSAAALIGLVLAFFVGLVVPDDVGVPARQTNVTDRPSKPRMP